MQKQLEDILDNLLGLLLLEGSYDIEENDELFNVKIDTPDAGRLIGFKGESLTALQYLTNQILSRKSVLSEVEGFKRVIVDVADWRKQKEEGLTNKAREWMEKVLQSGEPLELEPMPSWQRRIVHIVVSESEGVESESVGEGRDRHLVIKPAR